MGVIVLMCESAYSGTPALGPQSYARPCFPQDSLFQEGCGWLDWPLEAWLPCLPPSPEGRRAGLGGHSQWHQGLNSATGRQGQRPELGNGQAGPKPELRNGQAGPRPELGNRQAGPRPELGNGQAGPKA